MMNSLRARLSVGIAVTTAAMLGIAGWSLYVLIRTQLYREFDAGLVDQARMMTNIVEDSDGRIQTEIAEHSSSVISAADGAFYYALWNTDGSLIEQSAELAAADIQPLGHSPDHAVFRNIALPGGAPGRMIALQFVPRKDDDKDEVQVSADLPPHDVVLVLARETEALEATLTTIRTLLLAVFGITIVGLLVLTPLIVGAGLQPLRRVSTELAALDPHSLSARLDTSQTPREIAHVVERLNELLGRLESAFGRERTFSANVAHELRTPLAGLRATLEVALSKTSGAHDNRSALRKCLDICKHTSALVENLLLLARLDASQVQLSCEDVALCQLLHGEWTAFAERAAERRLLIEWQLEKEHTVAADRSLLALVVRNLFDNAVTYAVTGGRIRVTVSVQDYVATVAISNPVSDVPPNMKEQMFDRFWRLDTSRTGTGIHAGLGLAICRQVSDLLGGQVSASIGDGEFTACLRIPATFSDGKRDNRSPSMSDFTE